jgi:hypothetical protein
MLYIVTYATHSNKYIETLKESCPDLIILEDTDSKINEIIKFCKSKKKDDIICVIDSFNIVVLSSKSEIEEKFNSLNCDLCFSKDIVPKTILEKYIQYKSLNKYNRSDLNSSMYIGKAHSIINFWNSNSKNYKIDVDNIIFNSCIITSPETDVPDIKSKFWSSELILIIICLLILFLMKDKTLGFKICLILFLEFVHYELFVKHIDHSHTNKYMYCLCNIIHEAINVYIYYLCFDFKCASDNLMLINIFYLINISLVFIFKKCIFTTLKNKILDIDDDFGKVTNNKKYKFFYDINEKYEITKDNNIQTWFSENTFMLILVLFLNLYCFLQKNKII